LQFADSEFLLRYTLQYFAPDFELDVRPSNMDNANSYEYLEKIKIQVLENLKRTTFAPSVQMTDVPADPQGMDDEADAILDDLDEDENKDKRHTKRRWDKYVEKEGELSDSDDEEENDNNGVRRQANIRKRRNLMDYHNPNAAAYGNDSGAPSPHVAGSQDGDLAEEIANGDSTTFDHKKSGSVSPPAGNESADSSSVSQHDSPRTHAVEEPDIEMADQPADQPAAPPELIINGAQEKTPPESPDTGDMAASAPTESNAAAADDEMEDENSLETVEVGKEQGSTENTAHIPTLEKEKDNTGSSHL